MPDMPIFAFILLGIMLFAFAALSFVFFLIDHRDKLYSFDDDAVMNSGSFECEFRRDGGAKYEHTSVKLVFCGDEKNSKLEYSSKPSERARTVTREYEVPSELGLRLRELYKEHCFPVLSDCDKREDISTDVPVSSVTFRAGGQSYKADSEQLFPEASSTVISDIENMLMAYVK